jgi:hypothetical protein
MMMLATTSGAYAQAGLGGDRGGGGAQRGGDGGGGGAGGESIGAPSIGEGRGGGDRAPEARGDEAPSRGSDGAGSAEPRRSAGDEGGKSPRRARTANDGGDRKSSKAEQPAKAAGQREKRDGNDDTRAAAKDRSDDGDRADRKQRKDDDAEDTARDASPTKEPQAAKAVKSDTPERAKHADLSGDKRERVQKALRTDRDVKRRTDVGIDISVGRRLPRDWDFTPVPTVVIEVVPEYRGYVFAYVDDEYVICDPDTYEVVALIPYDEGAEYAGSGPRECPAHLTLDRHERDLILRSARLGREVNVSDLEIGWSVPADITLETFPEPVLDAAGELSACRYFIADDQLAIVDPEREKVVLLIDKG